MKDSKITLFTMIVEISPIPLIVRIWNNTEKKGYSICIYIVVPSYPDNPLLLSTQGSYSVPQENGKNITNLDKYIVIIVNLARLLNSSTSPEGTDN